MIEDIVIVDDHMEFCYATMLVLLPAFTLSSNCLLPAKKLIPDIVTAW